MDLFYSFANNAKATRLPLEEKSHGSSLGRTIVKAQLGAFLLWIKKDL
jgi:hypothetical protein